MLDDFQVDNEGEDKSLGEEQYIDNVVDQPEFIDPNSGDEEEAKIASATAHEEEEKKLVTEEEPEGEPETE